MEHHHRWVQGEIARWQKENVVSVAQADQLRARYPLDDALERGSTPWGLLVFATAGAIVVGLGVILLFAYNWDEIPKAGKLALVFGSLISAHLGAAALLKKGGWQAKLAEAIAVLGTMFYGAGIWLIAQIYHIDEHYPNGFLFWALGALAMAWALRSTTNGLLAVVLLATWGSVEAIDFRSPQIGSVLLIAGGLLPLAWHQRSALLLAAILTALQVLLVVNVVQWGGAPLAFTTALAWAVTLVAGARILQATARDFPGATTVLSLFGFGGFFVCTYLLTFRGAVDDLLGWSRHSHGSALEIGYVCAWSLFAVGLLSWFALARGVSGPRRIVVRREEWLLPIALVYCFVIAAAGPQGSELMVAWSFNLILLGVAIMWMWRGCQQSLLLPTVTGSLVLSAVVLARYFDLFQSLAARGFAFILLGGIFLVEAMYYRRLRRSEGGES